MSEKVKILIVEDEAEMREAIKLRLEANQFEVITAADGSEGLSKSRTEKPNLIILDIMLPKLDGFRLCRMLKFDENYKNIPVIILTAKTQKTDINRGKEMGAEAYITKPFKSEELLAEINELLAKK